MRTCTWFWHNNCPFTSPTRLTPRMIFMSVYTCTPHHFWFPYQCHHRPLSLMTTITKGHLYRSKQFWLCADSEDIDPLPLKCILWRYRTTNSVTKKQQHPNSMWRNRSKGVNSHDCFTLIICFPWNNFGGIYIGTLSFIKKYLILMQWCSAILWAK